MKICPECGEALLDVKRLELKPGEVLFLIRQADAPAMSRNKMERLRHAAQEVFPQNEVHVLQDIDLVVVPPTTSP